MTEKNKTDLVEHSVKLKKPTPPTDKPLEAPVEYGGPKGQEPTRYGDWEKNGRCIDF